jgi:hypothetical protein
MNTSNLLRMATVTYYLHYKSVGICGIPPGRGYIPSRWRLNLLVRHIQRGKSMFESVYYVFLNFSNFSLSLLLRRTAHHEQQVLAEPRPTEIENK